MPIFTYSCGHCKVKEDLLVRNTIQKQVCPQCNKVMRKELSAPAGFILKGEGFYKPSPSRL